MSIIYIICIFFVYIPELELIFLRVFLLQYIFCHLFKE